MKFMSCTGGYSLLDHRRNEDISEELKVYACLISTISSRFIPAIK
jgi:hypothetical protein